ncbi:uncharacterized protein [Diadema antillarum]|uniref:uncharacterized protein n=1 Tax=Diadema antillarum TaxID=105358 RepID=UPI003A8C6122
MICVPCNPMTNHAERSSEFKDDAVGESSENKVLVEAMQAIDKQLTVMSEQQQEKDIEESRLQQENEALRLVQEKMYSEQEQLKSELTVTQHELNNLQLSEDRGPPMRASADSIPDILEDGEDLSDKQRNRQSYSGDSSATESEDSKTMESSEAEEHTVVQDVEGKSFDDHDVDIPMMVQPEVQPEVGAAVACQVVNEQLSELRSAVHEQLQGPRAAATEGSGSEEQERTQENSDTCTKDIERGDPKGEGQVATETGGPVESERQEVRADDSLEDAGYHGDSDNPDVTPSAGGGAEEIHDADRQALLPRETSESVPLVDENSNVGTGVDETPMVERTLDVAETQDLNTDVATVESTEDPSLLGHSDADSSAAQVESLGDTPREEADSDPVATEPNLPTTEWQGPPSPCHIEVVDSITNSGDLISNVERSDEKHDLGPEGEKPETIPSVGKVETIPTDVPGQTKLEVPEGDSRPASIISLDSASSDVPVGSTTDEQDDTDGEKPVEGTKTQDTPSSRNTDATSPIIV